MFQVWGYLRNLMFVSHTSICGQFDYDFKYMLCSFQKSCLNLGHIFPSQIEGNPFLAGKIMYFLHKRIRAFDYQSLSVVYCPLSLVYIIKLLFGETPKQPK